MSGARTPVAGRRPTVVFLIANQPLPRDRRVWQECRSVQRLGCRVIAISRTGTVPGTEGTFDEVDGIPIHRYPMTPSEGGLAAYGREFGAALWHSARLLRRVAQRTRVDVVHAGNPPDFLLLAGLGLKRRGTRLILDHHDLSPELYESRSGRRGPVYAALRALERLSFRAADVVISTNESYRRVALARGGKDPDDVFVVRNGPDLSRFHLVAPDPSLKRGTPFLLAYAGVMGRQDGIGHALAALAALWRRRQDWHAVLVGDGEVLPAMRALARELGIGDAVTFPGWLPNDGVLRVLSTADVCLAPDPPSPANDASTMIKIMEYMALARPIVSFDLPESRVSAGQAARFASGDDVELFARRIDELLDDPAARVSLGEAGRRRIADGLAWEHSERALRRAYDRVLAP
ncbi:MAG TPA: glycosyltransferase family 4 protein [Baekduia sp.]|nr:glycosyltransferase family 4 protein [Baekduia sp.]